MYECNARASSAAKTLSGSGQKSRPMPSTIVFTFYVALFTRCYKQYTRHHEPIKLAIDANQ